MVLLAKCSTFDAPWSIFIALTDNTTGTLLLILSDLSSKRPIFATVMMLGLVALGFFSYKRLSVEMFPNVEMPVISIVTKYPGASPDTVEREVINRP